MFKRKEWNVTRASLQLFWSLSPAHPLSVRTDEQEATVSMPLKYVNASIQKRLFARRT
jgi:hypothetical protein